jgi:Protein of unknown function (DUF499)/Swt1-like HEPN
MALEQQQRDNLSKALGLFIEAFRPYIVSLLIKEYGEYWPVEFAKNLSSDQLKTWNENLKLGKEPFGLIDYMHFKFFAIKNKELLKPDFDKKTNDIPAWLGEITEVRHKIAHYDNTLEEDEATKAWIHMKTIAKAINMPELESALKSLQTGNVVVPEIKPTPTNIKTNAAHPWFLTVTPHLDIRQGKLDESVFAANLAEVALGNGREIYNNPTVFFSKTFFTAGLKNVAKTVISGLNGVEDAENRVISLQTGFGGGKTHTLISLYHICKGGKNVANSADTKELFAYTGVPNFDTANIAVFTNTTTDAATGRTTADGIHIQTIWGELAYQLGGAKAYDIVRKNDEQLIAPAGLFKKVLELTKPSLILIDELADYCVKASARKTGSTSLADQTISFMQELTQAVAETNNCVAVITLPASPQEVGNTPEAQAILTSLQKRVSRIGADTQPVADDEIYEVIRRRLFEDIGDKQVIEDVVSKYVALYQEFKIELPANASKSEYKQRLLKSYPFHPELIDVFRIRWASSHDFQRTRGALRLLAAIVSDLWKRQQSIPGSNLLIHAGNVNFANLDAMSGQLKKLYGNAYEAVISADVAGAASNAFKIDNNKTEYGAWYLTQSIASIILMNSFGNDGANKGISVPEIKLNLLTPEGFNHNNINGSLAEMESSAYYLYYAQSGSLGKRYWFHTKPNINILINQARADIQQPDIDAEILNLIKGKTSNKIELFNIIVSPTNDIPEQLKPTLIVLAPSQYGSSTDIPKSTKDIISNFATKKGNSERIYRNTMLFLMCSEIGIGKLQSEIREYLAGQKISREYNSQLEPEQRTDLKKRTDDSLKQSELALVSAYSLVIKHSSKNGIETLALQNFKESFETQINTNIIGALKEEEWLLDSVGLSTLQNNNLLPSVGNAIKAKDIYEAFLRFDDKPMITGKEAVSRSLQKYCSNGEYCIATGDGTTFSRYYFQENIPFFEVDDITYWLVDKSFKPQPQIATITNDGTGTTPNPISTVNEPPIGANYPSIDTTVKQFKSISISGKVPLEQYTQIFNSFIVPLATNNIEIEIRIKGKSTAAKPLSETSQEYKIVKESAKQLGLNFDEEI